MSYKAGIIGLPNVGKSTLFNAITNSNVEAANYPFATINPNTGIVINRDERLTQLSNFYKPARTIYATFDFVDIAGLVKGASKGEGLGNQFLSHIKECDALVEIVRCFESEDIIHVEGSIDPIRDIEIINLELILKDLETVTSRLGKVETKARTSKDKESVFECNILKRAKDQLESNKSIRDLELNEEEKKYLSKIIGLLTIKPIIYVANVKEEDYLNIELNSYYLKVKEYAEKENNKCIPISCEIEYQLSKLTRDEQLEYLKELKTTESGLDKIIKETYSLLHLKSFFTAGTDECRAWTFLENTSAKKCAGIIHSDFEKGFIKAEIYSYEDFQKYQDEIKIKEAGLLRTEGKDYIMKDGDIVFFRFNV